MSGEIHNEPEANADAEKEVKNEFNPDDMIKRMETLEKTNERLLTESKDWKGKYRNLKDGVENEKKQVLQDSENWKELLDIEKNKTHELHENLTGMKKQVLREKLHFEVAKHARDAYDISDVINALPRDVVSINDESLEVQGVSEAVQMLKDKKHWLFDTKKGSGQPSTRPTGSDGRISYEELSKTEKDKLFMESLKGF